MSAMFFHPYQEVYMLHHFFSRYTVNQNGATAVEYALLAAGIALSIVGVVFVIGGDLVALFTTISDIFSTASEARS